MPDNRLHLYPLRECMALHPHNPTDSYKISDICWATPSCNTNNENTKIQRLVLPPASVTQTDKQGKVSRLRAEVTVTSARFYFLYNAPPTIKTVLIFITVLQLCFYLTDYSVGEELF